MAILKNTRDKSIALLLEPLNYTEKEEYWFSVRFAFLSKKEKSFKVRGNFHINDCVSLIRKINDLLSNNTKDFKFEPLEPYIRLEMAFDSEEYVITARLSSGPIFNDQSYEELIIRVSKVALNNFVDEFIKDLKKIDSELIFEIVKL